MESIGLMPSDTESQAARKPANKWRITLFLVGLRIYERILTPTYCVWSIALQDLRPEEAEEKRCKARELELISRDQTKWTILVLRTPPTDFSGLQGYQNTQTLDKTI